jgi:hypothetical protein
MKQLPLHNGPLHFAGQISLEQTSRGIRPWRLTFKDLPLYQHQGLIGRTACPSGVRLNVISDTNTLQMTAVHTPYNDEVPAETVWKMDLLVDGKFHQRDTQPNDAGKETTFTFTDIPQGEHRLEVWLDVFHCVEVLSVAIDDNATAKPFNDTRPKWLVYGSSITHCRQAHGPSETWPSLVAQQFDLNLTSLGFGGNCHIDPMILRDMRGQPADLISTCVGINIMGGVSFNQRTFIPAVIGMIKTLREGHPVTPLVVVSPICSPPREETPNPVGMTLSDYRNQVREAVELVQSHDKDEHLFYHDGLELFGPDMAHHMPDLLHPNGDGIHVLAQHYADQIMPKLLNDLKSVAVV